MYKKLLWLLLSICQASYADPTIDIETEYYTVRGSTPDNIRTDMNQKRQDDYDAYTKWHVEWYFETAREDDFCELDQIDVTLDVKFILPQWQPSRHVSDEVETLWDDYYTALVEHEDQHKDIAVEMAEEIENALYELEGESSCKRLKKVANATANDILDEYKEAQKQFDVDTDHGMNEGAVFP